MPQLLEFVIAALACYRLAQLVALDEGPARIFERLREWSLTRQAARGGQSLAAFLECPYCQGVWYAGALALWLGPSDVAGWFVLAWALAGGQAFLQALGDRNGDAG